MNLLDALANVASIVTACIAALAYGKYRLGIAARRHRLEAYLAKASRKYMDELIRDLWMTEADIFEAARGNRCIETGIDPGAAPIAARLWFQHKGN